MSATQQPRPIWQVAPCPPWCVIEHGHGDMPEDRGCDGIIFEAPMRLEQAIEMTNDEYLLAVLRVYVHRHVTGQTSIHLSNDDNGVKEFDFLPDEIPELIEALQMALKDSQR